MRLEVIKTVHVFYVPVIDRIYSVILGRDGKNQKELSVKPGDIVEVFSK